MKKVALIDLDTLIFIVAYNQFIKLGNTEDEEAVKSNVKEFISNILVATKADLTCMFYQDRNHSNFRKYYYPDYKSNRPPSPDFIIRWKDTIIDSFKELGAVGLQVIESDDALNIGYNRFKNEYELIIVSADKDLNQIPGNHYNPKKNAGYFVTQQEALSCLLVQQLMGDATDGIQGIPKVGIKIANKLLEGYRDIYDATALIHSAYKKYFEDTWYSEYLKTKFLVTLLRDIDYNLYPFKEEVTPLFNPVKTSDIVQTNLFFT